MFSKKPSDQFQRTWAAIAVGAISIGVGVVQKNKANKDAKAAQAQIKPYKTPKEVFEVLSATEANASSGFDSETLSFLTNQTDNAFAGGIGAAQRLGADPNALSAIFGQKVNGIMQIGAQNHQLQMQNFSAYLNALGTLGANDAAEQKSKQDILKDQLQKIAIDKQVATGQISQGINSAISGAASYGMGQLFKDPNTGNNYTQQTTNTTGYIPPAIVPTSQSLRQTGLQIPQ